MLDGRHANCAVCVPASAILGAGLRLEGIVSKRVTSRYKSCSHLSWVKIKNRR